MSSTLIEVFADTVCPFAHVGLTRLVQRRDELGRDDVRLHIRAFPLEIVNGEPMAGDAVAHKAAALRQSVAPDLFGSFDGTRFPTTSLPALALTHAAYRRDAATGEAVALRLRQLTFDDTVDTGDPAVIAALAEANGLSVSEEDVAAVELDLREAKARGVIGSPHFFTTAGDMFCPALDVRKVDGEFDISVDYERFDELVAAIFT